MTPPRTLAAAFALAVLLPLTLSLVGGCEQNPPEPAFDNPFDPAGPDEGDPLDARAVYANGDLTVSWTHAAGFNIASYGIEMSLDPETGYEDLASDLPTEVSSYVVPDSLQTPNETQYFKVQAITFDGDFTLSSYANAAGVAVPPWAQAVPDQFGQPSRFMDLRIVVGRGDSLLVADGDGVAPSLVLVAAAPGDTVDTTFDWGPRSEGDLLSLEVTSFGNGYSSRVNARSFSVDFAPDVTVADESDAGTVATRDVMLEIPQTGVLDMRFAASREDLDAALPEAPAPTRIYRLADEAGPQTVWSRFSGDFGYDADVPVVVVPDLLRTVTFEVRDSDRVVEAPWAPVRCSAVATQMRFAASPDFAGSIWIPFADTTSIPIAPVPGRHVIYAQYRNDWGDSGVLTDYVDYIEQPVSVVLLAPEDGTVVAGGTSLRILGSAAGGSGGDLTAVALDLGDGVGFRDLGITAGPTADWSYDWNIPRFREDTEVVLRARAWADTDSATTISVVTVTQLAITMLRPVGGTVYAPDDEVTVSGSTMPPLGGAVDSVTVDAGGMRVEVTGTADWSGTWTAPATTDSAGVILTATAWADGDTVQTSVEVGLDGRTP